MTKAEKNQKIDELVEVLSSSNVVYVTDTADLNAEENSSLRRECFKRDITLQVVKNTLLVKAIEKVEGKNFNELSQVLTGTSAIMLSDTGNAPAKLIQAVRKKSKKPVLKGAYIDESVYIGDNQLDALVNIKSKEEVIADVIALLQSPANNVISALQSGGNTISGLVKTLSER